MLKPAFLWDEEKTRGLFKTHLILFIAGGILATLYTFLLPVNTPNRAAIILIPIIFTISCIPYLYFLKRPNPGIRFLLFTLEGQLAASAFMALTGGFLGIVQFAPIMFLLFAVFELGADAAVILGVFAVITFLGMLWYGIAQAQTNILVEFFYYVLTYVLIVIVERNIGKDISVQVEARKKLEEVDSMKNKFITLASTSLNSPLQTLKNIASTLQRSASSDEQKNEVAQLSNGIAQLEALIERLLTISSIQKGEIFITKRQANIQQVIAVLTENFKQMALQNQVSLELLPQGTIPEFAFDDDKMKIALGNILDNAIKFNKQPGRVVISASLNKNTVVIKIADTGRGIANEQIKDILSNSQNANVETVLQSKTTGLGLYIARLIIEAHQGSLSIESQDGIGTTVTVTLPATS